MLNFFRRGDQKKKIHIQGQEDMNVLPPTAFELPGVLIRHDAVIPEPPPQRPIFFRFGDDEDIEDRMGCFRVASFTQKKKEAEIDDEQETKEYAFSDIVDEDTEEAFDNYLSDEIVGNLIESVTWRGFILLVILLNTILVGLGTSSAIEKAAGTVLGGIDYVMLTIFVIEILLKWFNGFFVFWKSGWNIFDFLIVAISIIAKGVTYISSGRVLRILRVIRAFRALRSISLLEGLQVIVSTVLRSMPDMINVLVLMVIFMFIYAVVGMSLFAEAAPQYFTGLDDAYYSLFIMLSQDGWMDIFSTLKRPAATALRCRRVISPSRAASRLSDGGQFWPAAIYCMTFIMLGSFVFVNVLVGVTVNYLQDAYKEIEMRKKAKSRKLQRSSHKTKEQDVREDTNDVTRIPLEKWLAQKADEVPDFNKIPIAGLENYFLVLSAIEDNLVEFSKLKLTIEEIFEELQTLNQKDADDAEEEEEEAQTPMAGTRLVGPEAPAMPGDVLSLMMRQANMERDQRQRERQQAERVATVRRQAMVEGLQEQNQRQERALLWATGKLKQTMRDAKATQQAKAGKGFIKTVLNKLPVTPKDD
ncbi:putative cation channel sperm-associated protein 4 [Paratrimastix pyriformis]|uniref:Cation channel sperm-associated protein 4 n=1 Tax=Paratrimastix pyriformis TaxID=342808 RepID=A0ABQ8UK16_9EUKA|nr:putative cation channel sperm-associated protein 4 [Paratrimastix pyriformis]